jgi:S-DNA-T family DNA segregation ATPase FtsK/SpoIIIE
LPATVARTPSSAADVPELGLLDIPEIQEQRPLVWDPACHSHLSLVGQAGSGLRSVLSHIAAEHIRALPNRHLYLLDGDSSLRAVRDAPQVGAYVSTSDLKRAARVLQRVAELVTDRLNLAPGSPGTGALLTVFVTGWGRWASAFRSGRFAWAEDSLQDVVRDGEAAGVTVVIAGERELIASRFFPMVPNRLYLPLGASPEALLSWPKLPAVDPISGRAFVQGSISPDVDAVAQLITEPGIVPSRQPAQPPFRVAALPRIVSGAELKPAAFDTRTVRIPVGIGGDDLVPIHLVLPQRTPALVVGSAGTGKSQTLEVIAELAPPSLQCVRPAIDEDPEAFWKRAAATGTDSNNLLLVDDADLLPRDTHHLLAGMLATGSRGVFACSPSPTIAGSPALVGLRANPLGIVLGPRSATDGEIFGLRLDVDGKPPPGRGVLVDSGRSVEIQVAKVRRHRSE